MIYTWVNKVIRQNIRKRVEEIFAFSEAPIETQEQLLRGLDKQSTKHHLRAAASF